LWRVIERLTRAVPRAIRNAAYDWLARHRHGLAGGEPGATCLVLTREQRARFVDSDDAI
jgi:predicted DCC family thiol-disulfide oxidoreductase YuxK